MNRIFTLFALSLFMANAEAQVQKPEPFKNYMLVSSEGVAFSEKDGNALQAVPDEFDEKQAFVFEETDEGTYFIKEASNDYYVCKNSYWNDWSITFEASLPPDISKAKYTIEAIAGTEYVMLKNMHKSGLVGMNIGGVGVGKAIYCNLMPQENVKWKLVELPVDAENLYYKAHDKFVAYYESLTTYPGVQSEISDFIMLIEEKAGTAASPEDDVYFECMSDMAKYKNDINDGLAYIANISNVYDECVANIESDVKYPGFDDLKSAYEQTQEIFASSESGLQDLADAMEALQESLHTYYDSQIPFATLENPADLTYKIMHPNFRNDYNYSAGCSVSSEGWVSYNTGIPANSDINIGPQHSKLETDVTAYAAWTNVFDRMDVYQDIDDLPEGKYYVECQAYTSPGYLYKQNLFVTSGGLTERDYGKTDMEGKLDTMKTSPLIVHNGHLRLGFSSVQSSIGNFIGWYIVTGFKLKYCGKFTDDELKQMFESKITECEAQCDTMIFKGDKQCMSDTISKYKGATDIDVIKDAIASLDMAQSEAQKSVEKQVEVVNGIWASLADSIEGAQMFNGDYALMTGNLCECMETAVNSEDATYREMDSLQSALSKYRDSYLPVLYEARNMVVENAEAKAVMQDNIESQMTHLTGADVLPSYLTIDKYVSDLERAMAECRASDIIASGTDDFTAMIVNPGINSNTTRGAEGWNIVISGSGHGEYVSKGQQVDGDLGGYYLSAWHPTAGNALYHAWQKIENLPNGKYELKAMVRTTCDVGSYLFAFADNDSSTTVLKQIVMERMNITECGGPSASDGGDSIAVVSGMYGSIFADVYKRTDGGTNATDEQADTVNANGGRGHGWFYETLEIEVRDHVLTIGFTNDSTFTMKHGGVPFRGWWLSADNFSLRLLEEGNNDGWSPVAGITDTEMPDGDEIRVSIVDGSIVSNGEIYSLNGARVQSGSKVPSGVYIIRLGENTKKVLVR